MGNSQSADEAPKNVPIEELSHQLALRFATKCFTHLEITHFKDNFKSLADHQDGIEYWKEDTLCKFLSLPEELRVGSVLYQMTTYLGAFPFPSLAPCILTREAMLKVVTIMTDKYAKILKRGRHDKIRLLFRSLAVFDRRMSRGPALPSEKQKPSLDELVEEQRPDDQKEDPGLEKIRSHVAGFAIDEPSNDDEEEDDDELALAALDALDAIEVFKQDQKIDRKINHAQVPVDHFKKLIVLLLHLAPLDALDNIADFGQDLTKEHVRALEQVAGSIIAAFEPDESSQGVRYAAFTKAVSSSLPKLFEPLGALFEHFLFSKNIDLSKHKGPPSAATQRDVPIKTSPIMSTGSNNKQSSSLLTPAIVAHLSTFLSLTPASNSAGSNLFHSNARFHPLYSTTNHGTSLSSFSRQVLSWQSPTLLLVSGTSSSSKPPRVITLGTFLTTPWDKPSSSTDPSGTRPTLFQLSPRHAVFPANPYNRSTPTSHFSQKTGIALGCIPPPKSRTHGGTEQPPILGPVSVFIDSDIGTCTFQHDPASGVGAFLPDPGLESAQDRPGSAPNTQPKKVEFDIDILEVWGVNVSSEGEEEDSAAEKQRKRLKWEEDEAARRRGVNFGGDKDGARALLEMAGLVGDHASSGRTGGSV